MINFVKNTLLAILLFCSANMTLAQTTNKDFDGAFKRVSTFLYSNPGAVITTTDVDGCVHTATNPRSIGSTPSRTIIIIGDECFVPLPDVKPLPGFGKTVLFYVPKHVMVVRASEPSINWTFWPEYGVHVTKHDNVLGRMALVEMIQAFNASLKN